MISEEIKNSPIYKKTLKDERFRRGLTVYITIVVTVAVCLLAYALRQIDHTTTTIETTQRERTIDGQRSIRIAVSAAVACALTVDKPTYESVAKCVNMTVENQDPDIEEASP